MAKLISDRSLTGILQKKRTISITKGKRPWRIEFLFSNGTGINEVIEKIVYANSLEGAKSFARAEYKLFYEEKPKSFVCYEF